MRKEDGVDNRPCSSTQHTHKLSLCIVRFFQPAPRENAANLFIFLCSHVGGLLTDPRSGIIVGLANDQQTV